MASMHHEHHDLSHSSAPEIAGALLLATAFAIGLALAWPWWHP
jgi:hypothetical protein